MGNFVVRALGKQGKIREGMTWHRSPIYSETISEHLWTERLRQNVTTSSSSGTIKAALDPGDK